MQCLNIQQDRDWYNNPEQANLLLEFVKHCVGEKYEERISVVKSNKGDDWYLTFKLEFDDSEAEDIKAIINEMVGQTGDPLDSFNGIQETDFTVSIESEKLNPVSEHLTRLTTFDLQKRINALEYCLDDSYKKMSSNTHRIARLESYLEKTAVLEYGNFMCAFVDMLAEHGLIDGEKARSVLFPVQH